MSTTLPHTFEYVCVPIYYYMYLFILTLHFFKLGFTPLQGMQLQQKETKRLRHTGNLFRKSLQLEDIC